MYRNRAASRINGAMDSREARSRASEIKFVVDTVLGQQIRGWARTHLAPDPHGAGPFGDSYDTTSLYFDTDQFHVLERRGSYGRAKYRIRRYANADVVFLERKMRRPGLLVKRRTRTALELLPSLAVDRAGTAWNGTWFTARVAARRLAPVCQISYHRTARGLDTSDGPVRLTLDDGVLALPARQLEFTGGEGADVLPGCTVVELKFRGTTPAIFRRLVDEFALEPCATSKYRMGMRALGHVVADAGAAAGLAPAAEIRE